MRTYPKKRSYLEFLPHYNSLLAHVDIKVGDAYPNASTPYWLSLCFRTSRYFSLGSLFDRSFLSTPCLLSLVPSPPRLSEPSLSHLSYLHRPVSQNLHYLVSHTFTILSHIPSPSRLLSLQLLVAHPGIFPPLIGSPSRLSSNHLLLSFIFSFFFHPQYHTFFETIYRPYSRV